MKGLLWVRRLFLLSLTAAFFSGCKQGEGKGMGIDSILWWNPVPDVVVKEEYSSPVAYATSFSYDVDKDGRNEVLLCAGKKLRVLSGEDGHQKWATNEVGDMCMAGDTEGDGTVEILTFTEGEIDSIDGNPLPVTLPVLYLSAFTPDGVKKWSSPPLDLSYPFIDFSMSDVDNDGILDIFLFTSTGTYPEDKASALYRIAGDTGNIIWKYGKNLMDYILYGERTNIYFASMAIGDLNSDGSGEVVLVEDVNKELLAINSSNGSQLWKSSYKEWIPQWISPWLSLADIDGDGKIEVITEGGLIYNGSDGSLKYNISSLKIMESPYPEEKSSTLISIYPSIGYFYEGTGFEIFSWVKFVHETIDYTNRKIIYLGKKGYITAFNVDKGVLWKELLVESEHYVEFPLDWPAESLKYDIDPPVKNSLFVGLDDDAIPDIISIEYGIGIIQARDGKNGEGLFWYDFFSEESEEWDGISIYKLFGVFDINSDGKSELLALVYKREWAEETRLLVLKTDSVYYSEPSLRPWPMEKHDTYRTGNYNFVPE